MQCTKMNMSNGIQHIIQEHDNFVAYAENQLDAVKKIRFGLKMPNHYVSHVMFLPYHNAKLTRLSG